MKFSTTYLFSQIYQEEDNEEVETIIPQKTRIKSTGIIHRDPKLVNDDDDDEPIFKLLRLDKVKILQ